MRREKEMTKGKSEGKKRTREVSKLTDPLFSTTKGGNAEEIE